MFNFSKKKLDDDEETTPLQRLGKFIRENNIDTDDGAFLRDFEDEYDDEYDEYDEYDDEEEDDDEYDED